MRRALVLVAGLLALLPSAARAAVPVAPYRAHDAGGFHDVLPPGTNGLVTAPQLGAFLSRGERPPNSSSQFAMYENLLYATPGLTAAQLPLYFKDASFGVAPGQAARTYSPRADVTIVRDRAFGVPHVYGATREAARFGLGYVTAEDRLFFIDVLRHIGRAQMSSFLGGSAGNRKMDRDVWAKAAYSEADRRRQISNLPRAYGAEGRELAENLDAYAAGVNAYIAEARRDPGAKMPVEYALIGRASGPEPWTPADGVAISTLVGALFGGGGGGELEQAVLRSAFERRFGRIRGRTLWRGFRAFDDAEAPTTVRDRFPYQSIPARPAAGSVAVPDRGTVRFDGPLAAAGATSATGEADFGAQVRDQLIAAPKAMSNAALVSARESASGRPLAVMGPQTGYNAPQILMEQDVHAPGLEARGVSFAGLNQSVIIGRGRDYTFSATSAGQDITDTFALALCDPSGGPARLQSTGYRLDGRCRRFEVLTRVNRWKPTAADATRAGAETLTTLRSRLGLVIARALIRGRPVAYASLRSTYMHEVDSSRAFTRFNDPARMRTAEDFKRAASLVGFTYNWFWADRRHIAYFNSGDNPVRAARTDPTLPVHAAFPWRRYDAGRVTATYTPAREHPQAVDQATLVNWNNKQAPGFASARPGSSSVYRSQLLDDEVERRLRGASKLTLPGLVDAAQVAATKDIRAQYVLPPALRVLGRPADPALRAAVNRLRAWRAAGSQRIDRDRDGRYDRAEAIAILDAWWPRWVRAQFEPRLGRSLFDGLQAQLALENAPNNGGAHLGSAMQGGWYGYVHKDLRTVLGDRVRDGLGASYCGGGTVAGCRRVLSSSLRSALRVPASTLYADPGKVCPDPSVPDPQRCFDAIRFRALGAVIQPLLDWQNRPTYQQAVEVGASGAPR